MLDGFLAKSHQRFIAAPYACIFKLRSEQTYNLRQRSDLFTLQVNSMYHGTKSVSFLGPKFWDMVPS